MMPHSYNAVTGAGNNHLRQLERGIVSRGEATVRRHCYYLGVLEIACDDLTQFIYLLFACAVQANLTRVQ